MDRDKRLTSTAASHPISVIPLDRAGARSGPAASARVADIPDLDHHEVMARTHLTMAWTAMALTACSATRQPGQVFELAYGTTRYLPMSTDLANDYIPNDTTVIPKIIRKCGGRFLGFNGEITDGGEAAYFEAGQNIQLVTDCIAKVLPHVTLRLSMRGDKPAASGSATNDGASDLMNVH
jgi:hypothetical protein